MDPEAPRRSARPRPDWATAVSPRDAANGGVIDPAEAQLANVVTAPAGADESRGRPTTWRSIAAIALAGVISLAVFLAPIPWDDLAGYGYVGIFLLSLLSASSVFLPLPGLALAYTGGGVLDPLVVGLVAGLGNALGELTGYMAGRGGSAIVDDLPHYQRLEDLMSRYGGLVILVLAIIPNPVFDAAGLAAGVLRYPVWKFLLFCTIGKTIKTLAFAYLGDYSRDWLLWFLGGTGV